jgi:predicted transcriptional regulator
VGSRRQTRKSLAERYNPFVTKNTKFELENPAFVPDGEDEEKETLAAIDEGLGDVEAGRTVTSEEARKRLPTWITTSSTRKKH